MKHLGLFEGIGGFSLAARWMGWDTVAWCEINPFCQKVLKHHFPEAEPLTDIKQTDFTAYANRIDILTGGFPCQPYSTAGKRLGKEDDRHLWPEMLRAIREIKPVWVVGENVRGLISWNGGMVFDEVQADLENEGFEIVPFLLPACAVNADHRRDRVWFVAYSNSFGRQRRANKTQDKVSHKQLERFQPTDTWTYLSRPNSYNGKNGIPIGLDGSAFSKWRNETNKAGGNSIVPQVALQIFKAIEQYELLNP